MDITIVTLIISIGSALLTGLFGLLGHIKKCHSSCFDIDCTRNEEEREKRKLQSANGSLGSINSKSDILNS